jgi:hypothetical protein
MGYMSYRSAAAFLDKSVSVVQSWIVKHKLTVRFDPSGHPRLLRSEVEALMSDTNPKPRELPRHFRKGKRPGPSDADSGR